MPNGPSLIGGALLLFVATFASAAEDPVRLTVGTYPNAKSLPLHAGIAAGIFARRGLAVALAFPETSERQRAGLAAGDWQIVHFGVDNAVAMVDRAHLDAVIVMGGDSGMNEFFVQPEIAGFADLRGRTLVVDAPDTAYALQAKKILLPYGLLAGRDYRVKSVGSATLRLKAMTESRDNAAAVLNLPFTLEAERMGLKSLGRTVDMPGPYQAGGVFVMRAWASANAALLERYLTAYIDALRWVRDPANRAQAIALLVAKLSLSRDIAERTYALLLDPAFGFTPDAKLDAQGFRNTLALRAEIEGGSGAPGRYLDLSYYREALRLLAP